MTSEEQLFPDAAQLQRAFHGDVVVSPYPDMTDAAAGMILAHHKRREAVRQTYQLDALSCTNLRHAVRQFNTAEVELAALAMVIDQAVAQILRGRTHVSGVWHTETVGLVVSRMAELWLNYLDSQSHEDAYWVARMSDAYNCLVAELTTGRRLPPDM
ncbi:hypothetical protein [Nocardia wallacei]|uniref:hypothetical protein n=1 Tax=Nocardia wallacei TaxID=480035 RepID=UPI002456DE7D|nr:hypothetical protein [Nocardia wallacei]